MASRRGALRYVCWGIVAAIVALGAFIVHRMNTAPLDDAEVESVVRVHRLFNWIEGAIWMGVGSVLAWKHRRWHKSNLPALVAAVAFVLFGITDWIETQTGSWFRPTWLLVWNVGCVVALVACYVWHRREKRRSAGGMGTVTRDDVSPHR